MTLIKVSMPPITLITPYAFMQRFTQPERTALRKSTDDIVIDMLEGLKAASYININDTNLIAGLGYVESIGLLAAGRKDAMIVSGAEQEKHNGAL